MNTDNRSTNSSPNSTRRSSSRRRKGKRPAGQGAQPGNAPTTAQGNKRASGGGQNASAPTRNSNNRRRRGGRNGKTRTTPKLTGFELISYNYDKILADHLEARKRYYEMFFRAQPSQRDKLERLFYESLDKLYSFEETVPDEFKTQFHDKVNGLARDLVYSERREIPTKGEIEISESQIEDPHYLETQKSADYSSDTEESVGNYDDYKSYKGITE